MTDPQWTDPQRELMSVIYGSHGLWDPPCQHLGREWTIDAGGTGRCGMCMATWTMADERDREARKAAGPPPGESDRDRMWREFREAAWASRPLIMRLPPDDDPPRRYSFTRDEMADALGRLEVRIPATGPDAGKINAESMADALIEALTDRQGAGS